MGWFGRKSADLPPPFLACFGEFRDSLPASYQAQLKEVFLTNPVGQRAVRLVTGALSSLLIYALEGPADAAKLLHKGGLMEQIGASLLLQGNAYLQVVEALDTAGELHALRPEKVSCEVDAQGWPIAYVYKAQRRTSRIAKRDFLERTQLIHIRALHPGHDILGLGCLEAASASAAINQDRRSSVEWLQPAHGRVGQARSPAGLKGAGASLMRSRARKQLQPSMGKHGISPEARGCPGSCSPPNSASTASRWLVRNRHRRRTQSAEALWTRKRERPLGASCRLFDPMV